MTLVPIKHNVGLYSIVPYLNKIWVKGSRIFASKIYTHVLSQFYALNSIQIKPPFHSTDSRN